MGKLDMSLPVTARADRDRRVTGERGDAITNALRLASAECDA